MGKRATLKRTPKSQDKSFSCQQHSGIGYGVNAPGVGGLIQASPKSIEMSGLSFTSASFEFVPSSLFRCKKTRIKPIEVEFNKERPLSSNAERKYKKEDPKQANHHQHPRRQGDVLVDSWCLSFVSSQGILDWAIGTHILLPAGGLAAGTRSWETGYQQRTAVQSLLEKGISEQRCGEYLFWKEWLHPATP
ncbi:hypothetical protein DUI87_22800 [Hirundo rustica rustica]|uniref:Uncharacterized protein n=1 Tax=Hirundo rustica rustica TaxID=333673 RepID=A0A3M0JGE4_HIRRU|nr:hypothetical protein DUI87_22800 [Hirundo rustica rustica]